MGAAEDPNAREGPGRQHDDQRARAQRVQGDAAAGPTRQGPGNIAVWRPSVSAHPVLRLAYARRLSLDLTGDLVLVSLR